MMDTTKPALKDPFSLQRRNPKGGTAPLQGFGFRNETDRLTDVLLGSPAHLRHLSTSSLSRKHLPISSSSVSWPSKGPQ